MKTGELIENLYWYHTIELPDGRVTPGTYDLRPYLGKYGFPDSLDGKTVLDVGAADGFFSFEFEKRGASVFATDIHRYNGTLGIDPSPFARGEYIKKYAKFTGGNRLLIMKQILGSAVKFKYLSIYNLVSLGRKFDLVFCGDVIEHLKDPLGALENLREVTGELCIISLSNALLPSKLDRIFGRARKMVEYVGFDKGGSFFRFSPSAFGRALLASGFREVIIYSKFNLINVRKGNASPHLVFHGR